MDTDPVVIVAARRTPIGSFQGQFANLTAPELGAAAAAACLADAGLDGGDVDEVLMGCVLPAGIGQAPARQTALKGGVPVGVPCTTINKMCGSGMKAIMQGYDAIMANSASIVLAGGIESMTNAPYLLPKARGGFRMGHQQVQDHMFLDALEDPNDGELMGFYADATAKKYGFSREDQDAFAIESATRAKRAAEDGSFAAEIVPVTVKTRKAETTVGEDEGPGRVNVERIPTLRAAFTPDGTVTAASASSISDGAAAVVLMRASEADKRGIKPLARLSGHSSFAQEARWFTTSPVYAIKALHERLGWTPDAVDLYEVNEAFACVTMAAMHDVGLPHDKVNVNGGACALGHPVGATGARITTTLIHALRARGLNRGVASLCIGGGEATAIGIEIDI